MTAIEQPTAARVDDLLHRLRTGGRLTGVERAGLADLLAAVRRVTRADDHLHEHGDARRSGRLTAIEHAYHGWFGPRTDTTRRSAWCGQPVNSLPCPCSRAANPAETEEN